MDIEAFMAANEPKSRKPGKLSAHKEIILELDKKKFSLSQIKEFLASNGVTASKSAIHKFIGKHTAATVDESTSPSDIPKS